MKPTPDQTETIERGIGDLQRLLNLPAELSTSVRAALTGRDTPRR
jgi:hypothetical protein